MFTNLKIPADRRPMTRSEARTVTVIGAVITAALLYAVLEDFTTQKLSVVLILVFWVPLLVLHELGHAWMARALGWRVKEIVIGFGKDIWTWQSGETRIRIRKVPLEGYVLPSPSSADGMRWKSALIYAAGPGIELLLLLILGLALGWDAIFGPGDDLTTVALKSLAIAILIGAGFNLLPFPVEGGVTDGLGILSSPFMSEDVIQLRLSAAELRDVDRKLDAGELADAVALSTSILQRFPDNTVLQIAHAIALSAAGETAAARQVVEQYASSKSISDVIQNEWRLTRIRIELDADDADIATRDALILEGLQAKSVSSLDLFFDGAAKVRSGQYLEGGNLLAEAWRRNDAGVSDAELLLYLHRAAVGVGNNQAADYFLEMFEAVNRSKPLADRLTEAR